ncbi:MAG: 2-oxoglutarate and iron-dependent oxygenase domain-containing protein [Litoreibacter sp.]
MQIPKIDISPVASGRIEDAQAVAAKIDEAAKTVGFFVICGHGIAPKIFEDLYDALGRFFSLPATEKNACRLDAGFTRDADDYTPYGYSGLLEENAHAYMGRRDQPSDYVEKFSVGRLILDDEEELPFPTEGTAASFRQDVKLYFAACDNLARQLTELFAIALNLPRDYFAIRTNRSSDSLRLQTYPGYQRGFDNHQGMGEHTDGTLLTLLTDTSPGIEVKTRDGDWIRPVLDHIDDVLVNIGDLMMRWSNDEYVSTPHRVVLSDRSRQSVVYFKLANDEAIIEPFPMFLKAQSAKYPAIRYKDFSLGKMNALFDRDEKSN